MKSGERTVKSMEITPFPDHTEDVALCEEASDPPIWKLLNDRFVISIGLWKMLEKEYIDSWYTCFAAGAVVVSIPIAILFLLTQKFYVDGMSGAVKG